MRVIASGFLLAWMLGVVRVTAAEPETDIRFTALRPDGKPASGARVHAVTFPNAQASAEWRGKADANGAFQMPVHLIEPWDGCLTIDAPDCSVGVVRLGHLGLRKPQPGLPASNHVLQLKPLWILHGRVTDENGNGIASAQVVTSVLDARTYQSMWLRDARSGLLPELSTVSEPTGDFALRGIEFVRGLHVQGGIGLTAFTHRTGLLWCGEEVVPHPTKSDTSTAKPTRIILRPSIDVTGQVVDQASGAALPGVRVTAIAQGSILPTPSSTDAAGRFTLTNIPGYGLQRVDFERAGYATATVLPPSQPRHAVLRSVPPWKVSLGRPTRLAGTVRDSTSGGPTLVPLEIGIHTEELLPDGWMAKTAGIPVDPSGNPLRNGQFDVWLPPGPAKIAVEASTIDGAYQQPYRQTLSIEVPMGGRTNWNLPVERRPGILVQLEAADPQLLRRHGYGGDLLIQVREADGLGATLADCTPTWFFPAADWGRTLEVRMVRRRVQSENQTEDTEILPWTVLVADPKTWPIRLKVP